MNRRHMLKTTAAFVTLPTMMATAVLGQNAKSAEKKHADDTTMAGSHSLAMSRIAKDKATDPAVKRSYRGRSPSSRRSPTS
jgi:putative membrane protein